MNRAHELDDGLFVISDEGGWLPGVYASAIAADLAQQIKHLEEWGVLQRLQNEANERNGGFDGTITEFDLMAFKK